MSRFSFAASARRLAAASLAGLAVGVAASGLAACADPSSTSPELVAASDRSSAPGQVDPNATAAVNRDLIRLRAAMAPFKDFAAAEPAGYWYLFNGMCMETDAGGMGLHYVNVPDPGRGVTGLLDAMLDVEQPEALMYEPDRNGRLILVGVEYVVPKAASAEPPTLFNRVFDDGGDLWTLHVWAFKHNPKGMFTGWNPNVSCQFANVGTARAHH